MWDGGQKCPSLKGETMKWYWTSRLAKIVSGNKNNAPHPEVFKILDKRLTKADAIKILKIIGNYE